MNTTLYFGHIFMWIHLKSASALCFCLLQMAWNRCNANFDELLNITLAEVNTNTAIELSKQALFTLSFSFSRCKLRSR